MILIVALAAIVWGAATASTAECPVSTPESFQLAINGRRNETGHWIAQISMEHNEDMRPWEVDVKKTIKKCSGSKSVLLVVTVSEAAEPLELPRSTRVVSSAERNASTRLEMALLGYRHLPPFGYYKFHAEKQGWDNAKKKCEDEGAQLVIFNSREEFDSVKEEFNFSTYIHIGFHDKDEEGKYITLQGDPLESTGYVKWRPGKPENTRIKNCGFAYADGLYGDHNCVDMEQFVCEK